MEKIGLIVNPRKEGALKLVRKLKPWLRKRKKTVLEGTSRNFDGILKKADLLVCLGGDGTILHVAGRLTQSIPVLGVNLGRLGFLTSVSAREIFEELAKVFSDQYKIEERTLFRTLLTRSGRTEVFQGLNDAVVHREGLSNYLRIKVTAGGEDVMGFSGDGVIVSTPTGATAYSLSAGGPFLYPTFDGFLVTPLSAHSLLTRPIVLPTEKEIRLIIHIEKQKGRAALTVDGQTRRIISARDEIRIMKAPFRFKLVVSSHRSYLETLREKFGLSSARYT
ncbi:MAG TPA: NAD(+)/NADH kinase [Candidatus Omnitrophota bacterium]|nr:NAD(+)/NADH kinase [Candidatus Omnitrophota bacterium]